MRIFLLIMLCVFMPFFYLGFILGGVYTPLSQMYKSVFEHYKSQEPFGIFDRS